METSLSNDEFTDDDDQLIDANDLQSSPVPCNLIQNVTTPINTCNNRLTEKTNMTHGCKERYEKLTKDGLLSTVYIKDELYLNVKCEHPGIVTKWNDFEEQNDPACNHTNYAMGGSRRYSLASATNDNTVQIKDESNLHNENESVMGNSIQLNDTYIDDDQARVYQEERSITRQIPPGIQDAVETNYMPNVSEESTSIKCENSSSGEDISHVLTNNYLDSSGMPSRQQDENIM